MKRHYPLVIFSIWVLVGISILLTCEIPKEIDYERYMNIARNMFIHHQYILLKLHGHSYTDKPPLMFWLIVAGWKLWGISNWWPYLLMWLFAGGSICLTIKIAEKLSQEKDFAYLSGLLISIICYWSMAQGQVRVDIPLLFFSLLWHYSLLDFIEFKFSKKSFICAALSIALALLLKGPVILVIAILPSLIALFITKKLSKEILWFSALSLLLGIIIAAVWFVLAVMQGGYHVAHDLLIGQVSRRAQYAHESFYFYLVRLPYFLFPLSMLPSVWQGMFYAIKDFYKNDFKIQYSIVIITLQLLLFSVFGQKSIHYLLPAMPFLVIIITHFMDFKKSDYQVFRWMLVCMIGLELFALFLQSQDGLWLMNHLIHRSYVIYLVVLSIHPAQLYLLVTIGMLSLWLMQKNKNLLLVIILSSVLIQINFQIYTQNYYSARFLKYFKHDLKLLQQLHGKFYVLKDDHIIETNYPIKIIQAHEIKQYVADDSYILSAERCMFFNEKNLAKRPLSLYLPTIYKAIGVWKLNEATMQVVDYCLSKKSLDT